MTVVGVGIDIVSVPDFNEQLAKPGSRFATMFTPGERRDAAAGTAEDSRHLAARWAAKEAVIKAWSVSRFALSPALQVLRHHEIEVVTDRWGRPGIRLSGEIGTLLENATVHISLTHDGPMAAAVAIIEER